MDLKGVQEELKNDILNHQMLMTQLKKDPLNPLLKLKLKAVQQHIAELGTKQKKILGNMKNVNNRAISKNENVKKEPNSNCESNFVKPTTPHNTLQAILPKPEENQSSSKITLITIKNNNLKTVAPSNYQVSTAPENVPMNLSCMPSKPIKSETPYATTSNAVLPSQSQNLNENNHSSAPPATTPISISLSSLVSTGGVVTLAGGWKGPGQSKNQSTGDSLSRFLPGKPVQIKVPMMPNATANPVIVMQQKPNNNATSKSFRLLPKGRHPIPVNQVQRNVVNGAQKITIPNYPRRHMPGLSVISPKCRPAILVQGEKSAGNPPPYHQVVVRRMGGNSAQPASGPASTSSVTWQDLSSRTPGIHKPSYVPRKTFPNINNGVGTFQKYRILDGKPQIVSKPSQEPRSPTVTTQSSGNVQEVNKPQTAALKAVLTSKQSNSTQPGITHTRLFPKSIPQNGFYPIQPKEVSYAKDGAKKNINLTTSSGNTFVPVPMSSSGPQSSFVPVTSALYQHSRNDAFDGEETKEKILFLRNIDLIPKEQAEKLRSRRFRKRRVAANPVYSGGVYVSNEIESKRHCLEPVAGGLANVTPPGVTVKRPRGRPRGSTKLASQCNNLLNQHQANTRAVRATSTSPIKPEHVEELRQLRGILDIVASASKAVSSAGVSQEKAKKSTTVAPDHQAPQNSKIPLEHEKANNNDQDEHEDQCAICGRTGEVLMCDTCSRVYHLSCTTPPLTEVPQGMWICSICKNEFKNSKSGAKWPGIVSVVHAFMGHDKQREKDIEEEQEKLTQAKKMVNSLQMQTKTLTSAVMAKVSLRSKAIKEKQNIQKEITDFQNMIQNIWDGARNTAESTS